jgi:hypothetical protein
MQAGFIYTSAAAIQAEIREKFCTTTNLTKNIIKNPSQWQSTNDENSPSFWNVTYMKYIWENVPYPTYSGLPHNQHNQE